MASDGVTNWYLYACKILDTLESFKIKLKLKKDYLYPIPSNQYPQDAIRPKNSKLITNKFEKIFMVKFPHWEEQVSFNLRQINNKKLKIIKIRQYLKNFFKTNYNKRNCFLISLGLNLFFYLLLATLGNI